MARAFTTYRYFRRNTFRTAHGLGRGSLWNAWIQANLNAYLPARYHRAKDEQTVMAQAADFARSIVGWSVGTIKQTMANAVNAWRRDEPKRMAARKAAADAQTAGMGIT